MQSSLTDARLLESNSQLSALAAYHKRSNTAMITKSNFKNQVLGGGQHRFTQVTKTNSLYQPPPSTHSVLMSATHPLLNPGQATALLCNNVLFKTEHVEEIIRHNRYERCWMRVSLRWVHIRIAKISLLSKHIRTENFPFKILALFRYSSHLWRAYRDRACLIIYLTFHTRLRKSVKLTLIRYFVFVYNHNYGQDYRKFSGGGEGSE